MKKHPIDEDFDEADASRRSVNPHVCISCRRSKSDNIKLCAECLEKKLAALEKENARLQKRLDEWVQTCEACSRAQVEGDW